MILLLCLIGLHKIISVKLMKCDQRFCTLGGGYSKRGTKRRRAGVGLDSSGGWLVWQYRRLVVEARKKRI